MALSDNPFIGIDPARLATMQELYITVVEEIATTGQNYSINGRTFAAADLDKIKATLFEITQARNAAARGSRRVAYPVFHNVPLNE